MVIAREQICLSRTQSRRFYKKLIYHKETTPIINRVVRIYIDMYIHIHICEIINIIYLHKIIVL